MKKICFILLAAILFVSCGPTTVIESNSYQPAPSAPVEEVSYQSFYDLLSPYGNWINYPGYGYVWSPNVGSDFQPYATNGNWIYTDAGWTWASNYSWGWAPFHYGRWFYENGYGWMWVPGSEWAPAWVSWRGGGDYYGWAPLGPSVSVNVALNSYNPPANYWNFVPRQYMGNPNWHNYYVGGSRNVTIINNTTIINNYSGTNKSMYAYAPGPDPNEVRRYSGNNFTPVQLRQSSTPGARVSGTQYQIYQPRVSAVPATRGDASARPTPAPARYESFNNTRPSNQYPAAQPVNNPRTEPSNPGYSQPSTNPGYSQPSSNPRPSASNPGNDQPAGNQRPMASNPAAVQPAYTPRTPSSNPAGSQPVNSPRPAPGNPGNTATTQPVNHQPVYNQSAVNPKPANPNEKRLNQYNQNPGNVHPVPNSATSQHNPANSSGQNTGRPVKTTPNPNNVHPAAKPAPKENKPESKTENPPKTREANNN